MAATGESSTPSHFDYEDYEELLTKQRKETKELRGTKLCYERVILLVFGCFFFGFFFSLSFFSFVSLTGKIQALKKGIPKGDRKKKKEVSFSVRHVSMPTVAIIIHTPLKKIATVGMANE